MSKISNQKNISNSEFVRLLLAEGNPNFTVQKKEKKNFLDSFLSLFHIDLVNPFQMIKSNYSYQDYADNSSDEEEQPTGSEYVEDPYPEKEVTEPIVYLYNTHQLEEYKQENQESYNVTPNVMMLSYIVREKLNDKGIPTIVEENDVSAFLQANNWSYASSYKVTRLLMEDAKTKNVLMLGYMNEMAYKTTLETKQVTFWSRSRNCLWTKGETSGNKLELVSINVDCDNDTLLVKVHPTGPVCHTGSDTCWQESNNNISFLSELQDFISKRYEEMPEKSYTTSLFKDGINRMAQKVGEEAVEMVIEATNGTNERLVYECSDLIYHMIVLLTSKGLTINDVIKELEIRHNPSWHKH